MGKWGKYEKHYNREWEKEAWAKDWITKSAEKEINDGKGEVYCKICKTHLRAHKADLVKHKATKVHIQREKLLPKNLQLTRQQSLTAFGFENVSSGKKSCDLKLAVHIACHSAIMSIDHLGEILKVVGKGSQLENLQMHRTKCSKLISHVIAPSMLNDLVADVGESSYSIIIDESTDIATHKYMAFCIKYFSLNKNKMITDFLGIKEVPRTTAEDLYEAFTTFIQSIGLDLRNLFGIGTDGASNLCGVNHSLYTLLRDRDLPKLLLMKCVCHSLDKCSRKACEALPSSLEFMIRETRNWFSHSALRKEMYRELYEALSSGKAPPALVQLSTTRWLAWYGAVKTTLDQWDSLKLHFEIMASREKCYTARTLAQMYKDPTNKLYLVFLKPILREITLLNVAFQATNADVTKIYCELRALVLALASRVIRPEFIKQSNPGMLRKSELEMVEEAISREGAHLPVDRVRYGDAFSTLSLVVGLSTQELLQVKQRCSNVLIALVKELVHRLPTHVENAGKVRTLSPRIAMAKTARPSFQDLPLEYAGPTADLELLEIQWISLGTYKIIDIINSDGTEDIEIIKFWAAVYALKNAVGEPLFKELSMFALRVLSLPISNAVVERVFSFMNAIKTKARNKMSMPMLESIMRIRIHLQIHELCCRSFEPSATMINRYTSDMYDDKKKELVQNQEEEVNMLDRTLLESVQLFAADDD